MAADSFDPYYKWLGIPLEEQPPTHYRLLGIARFEADRDVITNAATRQAFHLRQLQVGPRAALAQRLLKEVAAAKATLLDPAAKAQYDQSLASDVGLPTEEIVPVATFRKKPVKAKRFDLTPLLVRVVPVVLIAAVLAFLLRGVDRKTVSQPDSVATTDPESQPPETVTDAEPAPESLRTDPLAAVANNDDEQVDRLADRPTRHRDTIEPDVVQPAAAETPRTDDAPAIAAAATPEMEPEAAPEVDPTKEPVPSDDDQSKAQKLVRSKHKVEFAKAKTAEQKVALARSLLAEGSETDDDPTDRYALFLAGIDLATAGGDFRLAAEGWNDLAEDYQVDALAGQWKVLEKSFKTKQLEALKTALGRLVEEAIDQDRYDLAREALKALLALSKADEAAQYETDLKDLDALVARYGEAKSALKTLQTDAGNPRANQVAGEFLSFFRLDWSQGLPLLSRSGDATLKGLANDELAKPDDPKSEVRLADAWWDFAEGQPDEKIKAAAKSRARFWYMEALPELQGNAREKAERRATLEARVKSPSPAEEKITASVLTDKFQGHASYDPATNQLTLVYDFAHEAQLKDFDSGAGWIAGQIDVPPEKSIRHLAKFKTLKMTGIVTMKSKAGDVIRGSNGMLAERDGASVKISSARDAASSNENGPPDDQRELPFEIDANDKLVVFRLGDQVVGKPMAKSEPGQILLCGGEAGAQFSQLVISGQPDPIWMAEFFGLPQTRAEKDTSAGASSPGKSAPKAKPSARFGHIAKINLWNEHNSVHNNSGTRTCDLTLSRAGKTVWQKKDLEIPWEPNQPTKLAVEVPQVVADSVRVTITAWRGESGGLSEVEVLDRADKNLAAGSLVVVSTEHRAGDPRNGATLIDGITDSQNEKVGYWLALNGQPGWADIRLLPEEAPPPAPSQHPAVPAKEPARAAGKSARKSLDAKIFATCDDAFDLCVNGTAVLDGKENELFSAGVALAAGDVITVKARNEAGLLGFCCVIRFSNGQLITTSDGWKAYRPIDLVQWGSPKGIRDPVPAVLGDSGWGMSDKAKAKFGVDAAEIWAPGKEDTCYLFYVVGPIDIPKKKTPK
ncbi:MAG TPA: hypothetical protein VHY91_08550 [Pirellulales bacterium]|jgi:hypothetical protein|nr:hypothetical protein [Pirellulales bacterium]